MKTNNKIKKIIILFVILSLTCSFTGCGKKVSKQHLNYGKKAVEIADQYLNYEISADEAHDLLDELTEREDELPETEDTDPTHLNDQHIELYVSFLESDFFSYDSSTEEYQDIIEHRDEIAETVGIKRIQKKEKEKYIPLMTTEESNAIEQKITNALNGYNIDYVFLTDYSGAVSISIKQQNSPVEQFQAFCEKCVEVVQNVQSDYGLPFGDLYISLDKGNDSVVSWRTEDLKTGSLSDLDNDLYLFNINIDDIQSSLED